MNRKGSMISGVVLAAGRATRLDEVKQLLPFRGKTILGQVVENTLKSSLHQVIVVLGYCAEQIQRAVDFSGVEVVVNEQYDQGQSTSLHAGLARVSEDSDGVLFILGDQPLVGAGVIDAIIESYHRDKAPVVIPIWRGRRGNPVLIGRSLFHRLESLTGDAGARVLFEEYSEQIKEVEVQHDGIHFDVDTWDDYVKLKTMEDRTL